MVDLKLYIIIIINFFHVLYTYEYWLERTTKFLTLLFSFHSVYTPCYKSFTFKTTGELKKIKMFDYEMSSF